MKASEKVGAGMMKLGSAPCASSALMAGRKVEIKSICNELGLNPFIVSRIPQGLLAPKAFGGELMESDMYLSSFQQCFKAVQHIVAKYGQPGFNGGSTVVQPGVNPG